MGLWNDHPLINLQCIIVTTILLWRQLVLSSIYILDNNMVTYVALIMTLYVYIYIKYGISDVSNYAVNQNLADTRTYERNFTAAAL